MDKPTHRVHSFALGCALLSLCACSADEDDGTQVVVQVFADPTVAARVVRVEWIARDSLRADIPWERAPAPIHAVAARFPFSFTLTETTTAHLQVSVKGYDSRAKDAQPIIGHDTIVNFVRDSKLWTSISFEAPCLDQAKECAGSSTCSPTAPDHCVPVSGATLSEPPML